MEEQICSLRLERERGLLLHTPTFSASLGADGLETVFLFFTHHCLFFFSPFPKDGDAKSKAVLSGRGSTGAEGTGGGGLICEVTLLTWPPSNMWCVAKEKGLERCARLLESVVVGVEGRRR